MSEIVNITGGYTGEIYGTYANAQAYVGALFGSQYTTWLSAETGDDSRKRSLVSAARFIDSQVWLDEVETFTLRDTFLNGTTPVFQLASYELAVLILADATLPQNQDQSSNIASMGAGSAQISFFAPTSTRTGTATVLPPIVQRLIGRYLASTTGAVAVGSLGQSGSSDSIFEPCDAYDRNDPY